MMYLLLVKDRFVSAFDLQKSNICFNVHETFNVRNSTFCPRVVFIYFLRISEQTAINYQII